MSPETRRVWRFALVQNREFQPVSQSLAIQFYRLVAIAAVSVSNHVSQRLVNSQGNPPAFLFRQAVDRAKFFDGGADYRQIARMAGHQKFHQKVHLESTNNTITRNSLSGWNSTGSATRLADVL